MCKCKTHEEEACHKIKKGVVHTMEHICSSRERNEMKYFTSQQLDDLKDCCDILHSLRASRYMPEGGALPAL